MIVEVVLNTPFSHPFDYRVPEFISNSLKIGARVIVPLQNRKVGGVVVKIKSKSNFKRLKQIHSIVENDILFSIQILQFTKWISEYYLSSWGEVLDAALPSGFSLRFVKIIRIQTDTRHPDQVFLKWIFGFQNKSYESLKNNANYPKYKYNVELLLKEKKLIVEICFQGRKRKEKTGKFYSLIHPPKKIRSNSKAEIILNLLEDGPKSLLEIKTLVKNPNQILKQLNENSNIQSFEAEEKKIPLDHPTQLAAFLELKQEQRFAYSRIKSGLAQKTYHPFLLHGITGSGKTEVYLYCVDYALKLKISSLILIPEISLTPQTYSRFHSRFGERVHILHSGMTEKARFDQWKNIKRKDLAVVIGARSAIFAPINHLGLIIIDEEHDSSYIQSESPQYNARDCAVKLASDLNITIVLGTATPSIESYYNAKNKKYELIQLKQRVFQQKLPKSEIIDLSNTQRVSGAFYLSFQLLEELKLNYQKRKQALIFLNRRGFASYLGCKKCESPILCKNCSIALTWHKNPSLLICHYCEYSTDKIPTSCSKCQHSYFKEEGIGTQRVEQNLKSYFPKAKFLRMDRDSIKNKNDLEIKIKLIQNNQVDFIIGTQLISKGHDFLNLGLVAVILADMSLNIPDFRASERSFQLIAQVSGRAGRTSKGEGKAFIQTFNPLHPVIQSAKEHDFIGFYKNEIEKRSILNNPPKSRLILIRLSDQSEYKVKENIQSLHVFLVKFLDKIQIEILGPIQSAIYKRNKRYYRQILLKSTKQTLLRNVCKSIFFGTNQGWKPKGGVRLTVNVDPQHFV